MKASVNEVGFLYPVLLDAKGRVIDGHHRLDVDPQWPAFTLKHIETDVQLHIARLVANFCRRQMRPEELRREVTWIAENTGWPPKRISEETGIPYRTLMRHLPDTYKDREMRELRLKREEKPKEESVVATWQRGANPEVRVEETQQLEKLEADASRLEVEEKHMKGFETATSKLEQPVEEEIERKKTFRCRACMEVYEEPIRPVHVVLCPECEMRFQIWKADRDVEKT